MLASPDEVVGEVTAYQAFDVHHNLLISRVVVTL